MDGSRHARHLRGDPDRYRGLPLHQRHAGQPPHRRRPHRAGRESRSDLRPDLRLRDHSEVPVAAGFSGHAGKRPGGRGFLDDRPDRVVRADRRDSRGSRRTRRRAPDAGRDPGRAALRGTAAGEIKVSFRSTGEVDVNALARHWEGGGHTKASGAMLPGPMERAVAEVLSVTREVVSGDAAEQKA